MGICDGRVVIVTGAGRGIGRGHALEFAKSKLARYKCPRTVDFVEALPRQDNGKIYKRLLRERYRQAESA